MKMRYVFFVEVFYMVKIENQLEENMEEENREDGKIEVMFLLKGK